MTRAPITLLDAVADPHLFAPWFKNPATWTAWLAFIAALFALPMTAEQLAIYRQCTGRDEPPSFPAQEGWLICGRRAGKSFILALIAVFLAAFYDYRQFLSPGERGTILVIAADRKQARVIMRYIRALIQRVPMLARLIEREWAEGFDLNNSVTIEVGTASFRSTRGYTLVAALLDELAFWRTDDAAEPDYEVLAAIKPGMATIPNAMLLCASSPYARRGALWTAYRQHFARAHDPVLVWQAATRIMNPCVPQRVIDEAYERDPSSAAAEYGAEFRSDIENFISREAVEACVSVGVHERAPVPGIRYTGFLDAAGGSGADSMTCAIAHKDGDGAVLDAVRERKPPFSPEQVTAEFAALFKAYRITRIVADRFAGSWPVEAFAKFGIKVEHSAKPKSDIYAALLPAINSRQADLLDHPKLISQLIGLELRTARGGRDSIDHPPGSHDDVINAAAGALTSIAAKRGYDSTMAWVGPLDDSAWCALQLRSHIFRTAGG
jgi:hypothetical protein